MTRVVVVSFLGLAGCTFPLMPGPVSHVRGDADWSGTSLTVSAIDAKDFSATSRPGMLEYQADASDWNPYLAKTLSTTLAERGAASSETPLLQVGIARINIEQQQATDSWKSEFWIRVVGPAGEKEYRGLASEVDYREATRVAADDALRAAVEDPALKASFAAPPK